MPRWPDRGGAPQVGGRGQSTAVDMDDVRRVIVVGAGLSGLAAARALTDSGVEVVDPGGARAYRRSGLDRGRHRSRRALDPRHGRQSDYQSRAPAWRADAICRRRQQLHRRLGADAAAPRWSTAESGAEGAEHHPDRPGSRRHRGVAPEDRNRGRSRHFPCERHADGDRGTRLDAGNAHTRFLAHDGGFTRRLGRRRRPAVGPVVG